MKYCVLEKIKEDKNLHKGKEIINILEYTDKEKRIINSWLKFLECAKLRTLGALVPYVPCVPSPLTCPHALRALVPCVPPRLACPRALRALAPCMPSRSRAFACLAYLTYLAYPRVLCALKFI